MCGVPELARQRFPHIRFVMFGIEARLKPLLDRCAELSKVTEIRHAEDVVRAEDKPSMALRSGRASSMRMAIDAVRDGSAAGWSPPAIPAR